MFIDHIGWTRNHFHITMEDELQQFIHIYWSAETRVNAKENRLLIYHNRSSEDILDYYGKNQLLIEWLGNPVYNRIGHFKTARYMKYHYYITIRKEQDDLIIDWKISNWYDPDKWKGGPDTISIKGLTNLFPVFDIVIKPY